MSERPLSGPQWAIPIDTPSTHDNADRTPSLVHSAQSQRINTLSPLPAAQCNVTLRPLPPSEAPAFGPLIDTDHLAGQGAGRGLYSLPTQQTMTIADGMGRIGPEYHFERRTSQPDEIEEEEGPILLNERFNPPPLEALPSDISIAQIQGIRPSDSINSVTHSQSHHATPGPLLRGPAAKLTPASTRYVTPPAQVGRERNRVEGPDTLSSGARTHPDLQPDGEQTPTYSLNSTPDASLNERTPTASITVGVGRSSVFNAQSVQQLNAASELDAARCASASASAAESGLPIEPFHSTDTRATTHTINTESGWQTIDSDEDNTSLGSQPATSLREDLSAVQAMGTSLANINLGDRPRLVLGQSGYRRRSIPSAAPVLIHRHSHPFPLPTGEAAPTKTAMQLWQDTVARKTGKAKLRAQLGLEDWEESESGKLPNYIRREQGEQLDIGTVRSTISLRPPLVTTRPSASSDGIIPIRQSANLSIASRRTSFLLLDNVSKKEKRARPVSSSGSSIERKGKEVKRTRSVSSEITKKLTQVKQRNHGGWISPSVNRKSTIAKPDAADVNESSQSGARRADKGKGRAVDLSSPIAEEGSPANTVEGKSPKSLWARLRSMSVDKIHLRPPTQVYSQSTSREVQPHDSFVDLESSTHIPLLPHAAVRDTNSRSLSQRISRFTSIKRVDTQTALAEPTPQYRLSRTLDRGLPVKQVPDPFKRLGPDDDPLASPVTTVIDDGPHPSALDLRKHDGVLDGLKRTFSTLGTTAARSIGTRRTTLPRNRSKIDEVSKVETAIGTSSSSPANTSPFRGLKSKAKAEKLFGQTFDVSQMDPYYTTTNPLTGPPGRHTLPPALPSSGRPSNETTSDPHEIFRDFDWPGPPPRPSSRVSSNRDVSTSHLHDTDAQADGGRMGRPVSAPISAAQKYALAYARRNSGEHEPKSKSSSSPVNPPNSAASPAGLKNANETTGPSEPFDPFKGFTLSEHPISRSWGVLSPPIGPEQHSESSVRDLRDEVVNHSKSSEATSNIEVTGSVAEESAVPVDTTIGATEYRRSGRRTQTQFPVRTSSLSGSVGLVLPDGAGSPLQVEADSLYLRKPASNRSLRRRSNPTTIFPKSKTHTSSPSLGAIGQVSPNDVSAIYVNPPKGRDQAVFTQSPMSFASSPVQRHAGPAMRIIPVTLSPGGVDVGTPRDDGHAHVESEVKTKTPRRGVSFAPSPEKHQPKKSPQLNVLPHGPLVVSTTVRHVRRTRSSIELARPLPPPIVASETLLPAYPAPLRSITPHVKFWTPVFRREDVRGVGKYHTGKGRAGRGNREGATHFWRPYALALSEISKPITQPHSDRLRVTVQTKAYIHLFSLNENVGDEPISGDVGSASGTRTPSATTQDVSTPMSPPTLMPSILRRIASWSRLKVEESAASQPSNRAPQSGEPTRAMFVEVAHREVERREICPWTWLKVFEANKYQIGTDDIASVDDARSSGNAVGSRVRWYEDDYKKCLMEFKFEEDAEKEVWILQLHDDMQHLRSVWKSHIDEKRMDAFLRGVSISEASRKQFDSYTQLERRRERAMTYGGDPYQGGLPTFYSSRASPDINENADSDSGSTRRLDVKRTAPVRSVPLKGILKKTKSMSQMARPAQRISLLLKDHDPTWWDMERVIQDQQPTEENQDEAAVIREPPGGPGASILEPKNADALDDGNSPTLPSQDDRVDPAVASLDDPTTSATTATVSLNQVKMYWRNAVILLSDASIPEVWQDGYFASVDPMPELIKSFSEQTTATDLVTNVSQQSQQSQQSVLRSMEPTSPAPAEVWQPKWEQTRRTPTSRASSTESRHRRNRSIASRHEVHDGYAETPSPDSPGITRSAPPPLPDHDESSEVDPTSPHESQWRMARTRATAFRSPIPDQIEPTGPLTDSKRQKGSTRSRLSSLGDKLRLRKKSSENQFKGAGVVAEVVTSKGADGEDVEERDDGVRGRHPTARASRNTSTFAVPAPSGPPPPGPQHSTSSFSLKNMLGAVEEVGVSLRSLGWGSGGAGSRSGHRGKMMDHLPTDPQARPHQAQRILEALDHVLSSGLDGTGNAPRDSMGADKETERAARTRKDSDVIHALVNVWGEQSYDD